MTTNGPRTLLTGRGLVESPRWHGDRLTSPTRPPARYSRWIRRPRRGHRERAVAAALHGLAPRRPPRLVSSQEACCCAWNPTAPWPPTPTWPPGWNDIVADGRGHVYVNGAGFNPLAGEALRPGGVSHVAPDGPVRQVADDLAFPNGMAIARRRDPDGRRLLPAPPGRLRHRHRRQPPGRRVWADLGEAAPDGICVDAENAVWYAEVPGKRCARVAEGGTELRTVPVDRGGFACILGGQDGTTLFITAAEWRGMTDGQMVASASGQVLAVDVDVPGGAGPDQATAGHGRAGAPSRPRVLFTAFTDVRRGTRQIAPGNSGKSRCPFGEPKTVDR